MAAAEHPPSAAQPPEVQPQSQPQPEPSDTTPKPRRKTSFSDALNKFTSNTFNRRRTTTNLPHSTSLASVHTQSRLPTPSGIPKSTSFFSTLNNFKSATTVPAPSTRSQIKPREKSTTNTDGNNTNSGKENKASFPKSTSTSRIPIAPASTQKKVGPNLAPSHRRVSTPYRHLTSPVTPTSATTHKPKTGSGNTNSSNGKNKSRRQSSVQITQHKLMQPLPPPLPKTNSTMSSLMTGSSANIVGSARTSMSSKRDSGVMVGGNGGGNVNANANANINANANANVNANTKVNDVDSRTTKQIETETDNPNPQATKATAKAKSPTQPQTQSPPVDVNKPLPDFHTNPLYIKTPQPTAYWCGRLSALNDRFRMEDITNTSSSSSSSSPSSSSNAPLTAAQRKLTDDERRTRRIFVHLQGLCVTDEARRSLDEFQMAYERKVSGKEGAGTAAEKGKMVAATMAKGVGAGAGAGEAKGAGGFLDKLRGKK